MAGQSGREARRAAEEATAARSGVAPLAAALVGARSVVRVWPEAMEPLAAEAPAAEAEGLKVVAEGQVAAG